MQRFGFNCSSACAPIEQPLGLTSALDLHSDSQSSCLLFGRAAQADQPSIDLGSSNVQGVPL